MNRKTDFTASKHFFVSLVLSSVLLFGIAIVFFATTGNRQVALTNQTYQRVNTCILSVPPAERTNDYLKKCYSDAEKITGQSIDRYGDARDDK